MHLRKVLFFCCLTSWGTSWLQHRFSNTRSSIKSKTAAFRDQSAVRFGFFSLRCTDPLAPSLTGGYKQLLQDEVNDLLAAGLPKYLTSISSMVQPAPVGWLLDDDTDNPEAWFLQAVIEGSDPAYIGPYRLRIVFGPEYVKQMRKTKQDPVDSFSDSAEWPSILFQSPIQHLAVDHLGHVRPSIGAWAQYITADSNGPAVSARPSLAATLRVVASLLTSSPPDIRPSPQAGVVRRVYVSEGQVIQPGAAMLAIEPA